MCSIHTTVGTFRASLETPQTCSIEDNFASMGSVLGVRVNN